MVQISMLSNKWLHLSYMTCSNIYDIVLPIYTCYVANPYFLFKDI